MGSSRRSDDNNNGDDRRLRRLDVQTQLARRLNTVACPTTNYQHLGCLWFQASTDRDVFFLQRSELRLFSNPSLLLKTVLCSIFFERSFGSDLHVFFKAFLGTAERLSKFSVWFTLYETVGTRKDCNPKKKVSFQLSMFMGENVDGSEIREKTPEIHKTSSNPCLFSWQILHI